MAKKSAQASFEVLLRKLARYFTSSVRSRGEAYYREGRVFLSEDDGGFWTMAVVSGSHAYTVIIDIEPKRKSWKVVLDCDCPYMDSLDGYCKHTWAVLLAQQAERPTSLSTFGVVPNRVNLTMLDDGRDMNDDMYWDDSEGDDEHVSFADEPFAIPFPLSYIPTDRSGNSRATRRNAKKLSEPRWTQWFRSIPPMHTPTAKTSQLAATAVEPLYVIDLAECTQRRAPVICLCQQTMTRTGKLGKVKRLPLGPVDIPRLSTETDRRIGLLLLGAGSVDALGKFASSTDLGWLPKQSDWTVRGSFQEALMPLLAASERFFWRTNRNTRLNRIEWDDGSPWELFLSLDRKDKTTYDINLALRRNGDRKPIAPGDRFLGQDTSLALFDSTLCRVDAHLCGEWLRRFEDSGPVSIKKSELPRMMEELSRFDAIPPVEWPDDLAVRTIADCDPQPHLELQIGAAGRHDSATPATADLFFHYDDLVVPGLAPGQFAVDADSKCMLYRQPKVEGTLLARLFDLGCRTVHYGEGLEVPQRRLPELVTTLVDEGWIVYGDAARYHAAGDFKIEVTTGIDWFDVDGHVEFGDQQASVPDLLAALRRGDKFVRLGDGSSGILPQAWLDRHRGWMDLGSSENGSLRFAKTQIGLIDALLAELPEATFDRELADLRGQIAGFSGIEPAQEPRGFQGELRAYQREGLGWLRFLDRFGWGGCLADDMGLGKTVQVLGWLANPEIQDGNGPSLVVAPKSVVFNWVREVERFAPWLRVIDYTGTLRKALRDGLPQCDLVVTTYGTLRRDIKFLSELAFNYIILDEAQAIKNATSQSAKAARVLRARRRVALTGTPVENHLGDLWSILDFLNPGMLGSVKAFKNLAGQSPRAAANDRHLHLIQAAVRPFILRRTKAKVAPELPVRSEQTVECELGKAQTKLYQELRDHYRASLMKRVDNVGLSRSKMHVLEALLRLRQAAIHPGLIDKSKAKAGSAKLDALLSMLEEITDEGHKALVYSQFTGMLSFVRAELDQRRTVYEYLDGHTRHRDACVDRFQNDEGCPLFLISLKAGGVGLNLTAADYVFILDPWWNPAIEAQAIDRTHRIGQTKCVNAYRLIARDTVEEKIVQLQQSKRELAEAIITEKNSLIRSLSREDLALLLS